MAKAGTEKTTVMTAIRYATKRRNGFSLSKKTALPAGSAVVKSM
jgi:hypothetical protein